MSDTLGRSPGLSRVNPSLADSPRPLDVRMSVGPAFDFVCQVCNGVDWPLIANLKTISRRQKNPWCVVIPSLDSTSAKLNASPCKVCRLLSVIKPSTLDGQQCALCAYMGAYGYAQLRVVSQQLYGMETLYLHKQLGQEVFPSLTVIGSNDDQDLMGIKCHSDRIDSKYYDDLKSMLRNCVKNHGQTCRPIFECPSIPGLKLIEASSGKITEAPEKCEYLALSYVWGNQQHSEDPRAAPAVIKDTFQVAEKLGLNYVWIDRYASIHNPRDIMQERGINKSSSAFPKKAQRSRKCLAEWARSTQMLTARLLQLQARAPKQACPVSRIAPVDNNGR